MMMGISGMVGISGMSELTGMLIMPRISGHTLSVITFQKHKQ